MDQSGTDIYQVDIELLTEAYAREGSSEASARKLCLIVVRNMAGRVMEGGSIQGKYTAWWTSINYITARERVRVRVRVRGRAKQTGMQGIEQG